MFKTAGSSDLKRLKNQAVICKNQDLPPTLISVDTSDTREGGNEIMSASWAHIFTQKKFVAVLKKQALVGTARKALSPVPSY
jgi:hypothetical protein